MASHTHTIFIRTVGGQTMSVPVRPSDTIRTVKESAQTTHGLSLEHQYLAYAGKNLRESLTVADYNLGDAITVDLLPRLMGGCYWCHDCAHNASAPPHRSSSCVDPRNSHGKKFRAHAEATACSQNTSNPQPGPSWSMTLVQSASMLLACIFVISLIFLPKELSVVVFMALSFWLFCGKMFLGVRFGDSLSFVLALGTSQSPDVTSRPQLGQPVRTLTNPQSSSREE